MLIQAFSIVESSHLHYSRSILTRNRSFTSPSYPDRIHNLYNSTSNTFPKTEMSAVQTFGKKKTATAVAHVTPGRGLVRLNGSPISLVEP